MAEEKKPAPKPAPKLARAWESGDPAVHQLLAEIATARSNGDDAALKAVTEELAALGYE